MVVSLARMLNSKLYVIKQPQDVSFGREEQIVCIGGHLRRLLGMSSLF